MKAPLDSSYQILTAKQSQPTHEYIHTFKKQLNCCIDESQGKIEVKKTRKRIRKDMSYFKHKNFTRL